MTATSSPTQLLSFEDYLVYEDGTDTRYELERGRLIPMGQAIGQHGQIIHFLERKFSAEIDRLELDWVARQAAIGVRIPRIGQRDTARCPDVCVLPRHQWESLLQREAIIELDEPPPLLVVEVVSKGTESRDHRTKRAENNILGIPCYVLVDWRAQDAKGKALDQRVTVLTLIEDLYEAAVYRGEESISIPTFPELKLTATQIISANY